MDNLITVNMQMQIGSGSTWNFTEVSFNQDTGDVIQPFGETQTILTTPTLITFSDSIPPGATPNVLMLVNMDNVSDILVDNDPSMGNFPQLIVPGRAIVWMPQVLPIYAVATIATCRMWVALG